jgi:alpha-glucosidase (family GH31 glycosyl hydrolase)
MLTRFVLFIGLVTVSLVSLCQEKTEIQKMILSTDEKVWAGVINDGHLMPFSSDYSMDFYGNNKANQLQPLILTSQGQFAWSEQPFSFELKVNEIIITDTYHQVVTGRSGTTLAEVQKYVRNTYFPSSGKLPDSLLFTSPQYNTWIELTYNQNQVDVLKYARGIIDHGFPPGVLMIDDTWQEDYGLWKFHPGRFTNPTEMVNKLHEMGFKVMLWICPFVSADQAMIYRKLCDLKAFILERNTETDTWQSQIKPLMVEWWNGQSAVLDFSNPLAVEWFNQQLVRLMNDYGIDGFKFDAGDMYFYPPNGISKGNITPNEQCELFARFGLLYPLNEYRACWKMGGQPLAQRLQDKAHSWDDLRKLIPNMVLEGLCGYPFSCPDMIGGGEWTSFLDPSTLDQDLMVRSAQCHALMPMMQFSAAPWRILDSAHLAAVNEAVALRAKFTPFIMQLAHEAATTGEPMMRCMEYEFPGQGFLNTRDQFMLGHTVLVAPMLEEGKTSRNVTLPEGKWKTAEGKILKGGNTYQLPVALDQLLYFEKVN